MFKKLFSNKQEIDEDFSKLIFKLYYSSAYKAAYFYCGDNFIAEEAAQEAIFKAIQNIDQLRDPDKIEAWIKRIAVNNATNLLNKSNRVVSLETSTSMLESLDDTPEYIIDSQEAVTAVNDAIQSLDSSMRQVIHLRYFEEMKVKNIALLLNKPEGTIKILLHRAKGFIKARLIKEGYVEVSEFKGGVKNE